MDKTPSAPTFSIASAIMSPISSLFPAEIEATALMSSLPLTSTANSFNFFVKKSDVLSIPFLMLTGLAPEATDCKPNMIISLAKMEAVVVPSPAESLVRPATSLINCAPASSTGSGSSINLAIETPSLITCGTPNFSSNTTFLPLGPKVIATASANLSIPACIFCLAAISKVKFLASARTIKFGL